jgi:hypothetical protein
MIQFLLNRWVVLVLGVLFMLIGLKPDWTMWVVRTIGKMGWAEQRVGRGSTFDIWKLIGILAPIAALIYFFSGGIQFEDSQSQSKTQTQWGDYR